MPIAQKKLSRGANASMSRPTSRPGADVLDAVGQRVGQLEVVRRPGLLDVVAGDRDRVEPRHLLRGVREDVGDDPHRRRRRVDVGVADHELLEDVVLDGPRQLLGRHALLLGRDDVERQHRQHRAVHRHRDAHLVERDALEQLAGVVDRVDRDAGHADVADDARVVGVVAAVGREVERDREALLAGREVAAVERVGLLGGREAGVLADRPRLGRVHRRVRTAQERRQARVGVEARRGPRGRRRCRGPRRRCPRARPTARRRRSRGRRSRDRARTAARGRAAGPGSCCGMLIGELLSDRTEEGQRVDAHRDGRVGADVRVLAGQDDVRRAGLAQRGDQVGAPRLVGRVVADQADDRRAAGLAVGRDDVVDALGRTGRRRCRRRRRRTGWPRRSRGRCSAAIGAHRGQEDRRGGRLVAQRLELAGVAVHRRADRSYGRRSGSVSCRFGNSETPVIGRCAPRDRERPVGDRRRSTRPRHQVERRLEAVGRVDLAEQLPGRAGQVVGELLDGVRAAGRVGDRRDVRLADQQARGVAGDAAAERLGQAERLVERQHRDRGGAADAGGERATVVRSMFTYGS